MTVIAIKAGGLHPGIKLRIARGNRQYPGTFDATALLAAPQLHAHFASGARVEVDVLGDGSRVVTGRVHTTGGPRPGFKLVYDARDYAQWELLDRRARVLRIWNANSRGWNTVS